MDLVLFNKKLRKVVLVMLPVLIFLIFISVSHAQDISATVTVISGQMKIEIQSPKNCTDYPNCTTSSYYKLKIPLNFTIDRTISNASYILDGKPEVNVTDNTTYNGTHTIGYTKFNVSKDGFHNITVKADTQLSNPNIFFYCLGDLDHDKKVDIRDIAFVARLFGSYCGYPTYNATADMNDDCKIDIMDIATVARQFGKIC